MSILVTGGAGYIGSHAVQRLLRDGYRVVAVDDLSRGHARALDQLEPRKNLVFEPVGVGQRELIETILREHNIDTVMHFAAYAYVGESVEQPLRYFRNNIADGIALLEACDRADVRRFVFSSSCATYGQPDEAHIPIDEDCPQAPVSPYGQTKLHFEQILRDWAQARETLRVTMLRYFNVAGADQSGILGEDHDPETHLVPVAIQAALGRRKGLAIFGTDYPTPDGTAIRDYVHVEDLARAHVLALQSMEPADGPSVRAFNVGTGRGHSVREVIDAVERVSGQRLNANEGPRRAGDPARLFAKADRIREQLGWVPECSDLTTIVSTAFQWMKEHPNGYGPA